MRLLNFEKVRNKICDSILANVGTKNVVIGISGGIDSAVVATLCAYILGPEKVFGIMLPYGQQFDISDSQKIVDQLKIKSFNIDIKPVVDQFNFFHDKFVIANIMSRIRMTYLYAFANLHHGLVVGTTNKSEYSIGYFTKFGDGGCDIEPITNLYKTEIFQFAKFLGIPESIINKKPSAGLWDGQTDEGELGFSYEQLDKFLEGEKIDQNIESKIKNLIEISEHKRNLPPVMSIE